MLKTRVIFLTALLLIASTSAYCNVFPEISLQKKVERSSLVVIGQVKSTTVYDRNCLHEYRCAEVKVSEVLKGKVPGKLIVLFGGEDTEANPLCCERGRSYLFFVTRVSGNYYATVNGPFGIYKVP